MPPPREPERTCVGCRAATGKWSLLRIVRGAGGVVVVDRDGTAPGRGAYVHPDRACVDAALSRGSLARALRTGVSTDEAARLRNAIERREVER